MRSKYVLIGLLAALAIAPPVLAGADDNPFSALVKDGNGLLAACGGPDSSPLMMSCYLYLQGIQDGWLLRARADENRKCSSAVHEPFCIPAEVTNQQIRDVVVNYLRDHPETRQYSSASEVVVALGKAWPCSVAPEPKGRPVARLRQNSGK